MSDLTRLKYFPVSTYRSAVDCTLNGISANNDHLLLVAPWAGSDLFGDYSTPRLYLTSFYGQMIALPYDPGAEEIQFLEHGFMFGGNHVWSNDSRFCELISSQPIKVFDRNERDPKWVGEFPQHNMSGFRKAALLLQDIHHMLATDSDLENVTAAARYQDLKRRADLVLHTLGSSAVNGPRPLLVQYPCPACKTTWHMEMRRAEDDLRLCPECETNLHTASEVQRLAPQF